MNFLAHILLAPDTESRIGALLGDFVTVTSEAQFGAVIHREILLHRKIDSFTDSHPRVLATKALFRKETRRFAGILLDVFYDHLLAREWSRYCPQPLSEFVQFFYQDAARYRAVFPPDFARTFEYLVAENWLESYRQFAGVETAIRRIAMRRPKFAAPLVDGLGDLRAQETAIARDFPDFFADLSRGVPEWRLRATAVGAS